jgi:Tfp pilus assembly protein PilV
MQFFFQRKQKNRGVTLVETVIYVLFFASIITVMIYGLASAFKAYAFTRGKRQIAIDANLAMERMVREIRQAASVDDGASSFGVNPGVLKLNSTDSTGNPESVQFSVVNDVITVTENNIVTGGITSGITDVTNLTFTKLTTPVGAAIKIDLTVRSTKGITTTATFHNTAVMRGTY